MPKNLAEPGLRSRAFLMPVTDCMSYFSRLQANVASRQDMTGPGSLANVATCRNVSSLFADRGGGRVSEVKNSGPKRKNSSSQKCG